MPKFPENKGFKLPGLGAREINTPGGFREDSSACAGTPKGTSPLLAVDLDAYVPEYYRTSYTKTAWPKFTAKSKGQSDCADGQTRDADTGECKGSEVKVDEKKTITCKDGEILVDGKCQPKSQKEKPKETEVVTPKEEEKKEEPTGKLATYEEAWKKNLENIRTNSGAGKGYDKLADKYNIGADVKDRAYQAYVKEQEGFKSGSAQQTHKEAHRLAAERVEKGTYGIDNKGVKSKTGNLVNETLAKNVNCPEGKTYDTTTGICK